MNKCGATVAASTPSTKSRIWQSTSTGTSAVRARVSNVGMTTVMLSADRINAVNAATSAFPNSTSAATTATDDAQHSDDDEGSGLSQGAIIAVVAVFVLIACTIGALVALKKRSTHKPPRVENNRNATTTENAVFSLPVNTDAAPDNTPASDYHIPDFGEGNSAPSNGEATSQPDYAEVQNAVGSDGVAEPDYQTASDLGSKSPSNQVGGDTVGPDYQGATGIGNQAAAGTADPNYADASSLLPRLSLQASASAGDYDDVNFEGAARFNGLPPNAISNAPMYDKQPANNAVRPASLYDVMADDGVGAAPRSVQMIRGSAAQVPSERNNGASEVFGETQRRAAMF